MYTFRNTELNNEKASVFETKSMLYLIGKRGDSKEIEYVTFDCFNDVSGINKNHNKIWDIQSKNEKTLNPKKIGKYLFTLFDNYISGYPFKEFILFAPPLNSRYKIDNSLDYYKIDNITAETNSKIKNGLTDEILRVKGTFKDYTTQIEEFLNKVYITEDNSIENEYIKSIIKFKKTDLKSDEFYQSIFIDLRNIQSSKKNSFIENKTINEIREVLSFKRHLFVKDIELLIISRIIGNDIFSYKSIPLYFSTLIDGFCIEDKKDILEDCNANLSRAFFNKNSNKIFWKICEKIIIFITANKEYDVEIVYQTIFKGYNLRISYLNELTIQYLISIILEGIE